MIERNSPRILAAMAALALLCACARQPQAAQPDADANASVEQPASAPATPAVAGTWSGTLPCADCPGIDETLVLSEDGGFVLTDTYRERPDGTNTVRGHWSLETDDKRIRLSPEGEGAVDRFYGIDGDGLRMLDTEGQPIDSPIPMRLQRGG